MTPRCAIAVLLMLCAACCTTRQASAPDSGTEPRTVTVVTRAGARFPVHVEIAADDATRQQGLMYRRSLGADDGMLFLFGAPAMHSFWMKNTLIPLDMLFIKSDGTIAGIVAEATPETTDPRGVDAPTQYVLEVNGGWCAQKGVAAGDRVVLGDLPPAR